MIRLDRIRSALSAFRFERRGATVIEFALVAPVLAMLLMGAFDLAHRLYVESALQGVVQKTARDSSLETGTDAEVADALDQQVRDQVLQLAPNGEVTITRRAYRNYAAAARKAEAFTDVNKDGTCSNGEPYEDANRNGRWDLEGGSTGQGGALDATVYTATVVYPKLFPFWKMVGSSDHATARATTVLRNQPYGDQGTPTAGSCP